MRSISPLRYPGGKSRIYYKVQPILLSDAYKEYAEPFSGGFGLGLLFLKEKIVNKVYINDLDVNIYSFWKLATTDLNYIQINIKRISEFKNTDEWMKERENQLRILNSNRYGFKKKGFATLFLNRVNRSGILGAGPIGGAGQKGAYKINCRFNFERILDQLSWIFSERKNIKVTNLNYDDFVRSLNNDVFIFFDPPYVVKGVKLYMNDFKEEDHIMLQDFILKIRNPWILTYDNVQLIQRLYNKKGMNFIPFDLKHYAGKYKIGKEVFISSKFIIN